MAFLHKVKQLFKLIYDVLFADRFMNLRHKAISFGRKWLINIIVFVLTIGISFIIINPFISVFISAIEHLDDVYNRLVFAIPIHYTIQHFQTAMDIMDYFNTLAITLLYVSVITAGQVLICSIVGYGFARFDFPGKNLLFGGVILTIVVPASTIMVPLYIQFFRFDFFGLVTVANGTALNLLDGFVPIALLTLTGLGLRAGLYIFIFRQFFRGLPKEIEEASLIDGAGTFYTFYKIMIPNAVPSMITVVLFSFVWQYNDTYYVSMFMKKIQVMSKAVGNIGSRAPGYYGLTDKNLSLVYLVTCAAIVLIVAPLMVIYVGLQRYFVEGIERSGIVG